MWKIGQKIKFIKNGVHDSNIRNFTIGKYYEVTNAYKGDGSMNPMEYLDKDNYMYTVTNDNGNAWTIEPKAFLGKKKELKTEVEFLDAFKENFSYD